MDAGYIDEARNWLGWLLRAVAGNPEQAHILYGIGGERLLPEIELDWLPGYENSKPVRIGNAAANQFQIDVYGELFDALYQAHARGLPVSEDGLRVGLAILGHLETAWHQPDEGIWEVRGGPRHFTHSKVMAWVAFDRALRMHEMHESGATEEHARRWRAARDRIHAEVCEKGFDPELNSFVQSYGSKALDASLLLIAHTGFLPQDDPRVVGTVAAIGKNLMRDGFVLRYETEGQTTDGLKGNEGAFLPCTFWYADNLIGLGRRDEARAIIERLIGICTDLGLVSEEYDVQAKRLVGNFPQAFTHVALVNTLLSYTRGEGPADRQGGKGNGAPPPSCGSARRQAARARRTGRRTIMSGADTPAKAALAEIDTLSINTIRTLAIDAVQKANSGHAGAPMGLAPVAYTLWNRYLRYDPAHPHWPNRDRFVLSCGHASMLLYGLLHLAGVAESDGGNAPAVSLEDIKKFRQLDSRTPGHPEYHFTTGVETTTGPLGQGVANSVGMAMGSRYLGQHLNRPNLPLFDYNVYAICSTAT